MITQENQTNKKTWRGFNLTIVKVKSKSTRKNQNPYNKTYKPPRSTSYCYPPIELIDTTTCKLRIHRLLLSWILHQIQVHSLVFSLSFNGSNWNDHQGVEKPNKFLSFGIFHLFHSNKFVYIFHRYYSLKNLKIRYCRSCCFLLSSKVLMI